MNHKRGKPKSRRAGCLWCKPHKHEAHVKEPRSPAALAVVTERPQRERISIDEFVRFGSLVVDPGDFMLDVDYWDDWDPRDEEPPASAPLRVTLAEVAA